MEMRGLNFLSRYVGHIDFGMSILSPKLGPKVDSWELFDIFRTDKRQLAKVFVAMKVGNS
jgi:hypothetical protein